MPTNNPRECGTCSLCCKVMGVAELGKPRDVWCAHARPGQAHGCAIHGQQQRPASCGEFICAWVERDVMGEHLRPDRVHAFFTAAKQGVSAHALGEGMVLHVDPGYPLAHKQQPLAGVVAELVRNGVRVMVACGKRRHMLLGKTWITMADSDVLEVAP